MATDKLGILFGITDLASGGAEQAVVEIATRLAAVGHSCRVVSLAPPPRPPRSQLVPRLEEAGIEVAFLDAASWRHLPRTVSRFVGHLQAFQPHVVQSFLHHANLVAALAFKRVGRRDLLTGIRVAERRRNLHRWWARRTDRWVAKHVCVSQAVADFAARSIALPRSKLVVIPNGVDLRRFDDPPPLPRDSLGIPPKARVIACVGRLDRQKRLAWLLQRMPSLAAALPRHHLLLVGEGPEARRLRRLARQLGVDRRVHFVGWRTDIPAILATADLLVLTSAWEGSPNVLLEAMAAGRPVVASRAEGVDELLSPTAVDQLVGQQDAEGFAERVVRICRDASLARQLGAANRARARLFSWSATASAYERLYAAQGIGRRR
jgi:glycosyltransferase involved in cell wall biosynthesis